MGLQRYLAMTAAEFSAVRETRRGIGWMACHFSSYGTGLSNIPAALPEGSMVIVNDRTPPHGHDPELIANQLKELEESGNISLFLLDFQREGNEETMGIAEAVLKALDTPVGVSEVYAEGLACPVFLTCPPPHRTLEEAVSMWGKRPVWLEAATETVAAVVTETGCRFVPSREADLQQPFFTDKELHCKYHTQVFEDRAVFTMMRDNEALEELLQQAQDLGVEVAVGLYQQLGRGFLKE